MVSFLEQIWSIITALIDFVISLVQDLVYLVQLLAVFLSNSDALFSWLPTTIVSLTVVTLGLVVVYKVLGREG